MMCELQNRRFRIKLESKVKVTCTLNLHLVSSFIWFIEGVHIWPDDCLSGKYLITALTFKPTVKTSWAATCDFHQCCILTSVDSDEPVQPPLKFRNSKSWSVSSLTVIDYSSNQQRLWPGCAYAQADLILCWSHKPHCWKSHVAALMYFASFSVCNTYFSFFFERRSSYICHTVC